MNEKRVFHWVKNVERVLHEYRYNEPFSRFLTKFYKNNRQMGASDRRMTSRFCYNLFRLGNAFSSLSLLERLIIAEFLCESESPIVAVHDADLLNDILLPLEDKIAIMERRHGSFLEEVFPFTANLSPDVLSSSFSRSFFIQPDLFIRIKRTSIDRVAVDLERQGIHFRKISNRCFALPNGTNLQAIKGLHVDFEVQDLSSQRTEEFMTPAPNEKWWDCCAASGGKSLMILDQCPTIVLLVSDVRLSILRNLEERFDQARIHTPYRKKILDLSRPVEGLMGKEQFDGILLDAPCSGSGTWGRTPEMLGQFDEKRISEFSNLQKSITKNALPFLKKGGQLIYITCSVFREENEEIVSYIEKDLGLAKISQKNLLGYAEKADSMFIATFIKP